MIYAKIKASADQKPRKDGSILVANELYTMGEVRKYNISDALFDKVDVKPKETYWCFGARFA